ncbi:uncharacterized protein LOC143025610 [Oratosquilla oratoria]|uniref:uncharacterized protein LOC143025610 n=1 Tax=Oratosquilla oratoria TaxID=337810 RepID=UPI003F75C241
MARNSEKNYGQLNRLWLKNQGALDKEKRRPRLNELHTAEAVREVLPAILDEIDHSIKQSQCISYTDKKVEEYKERVVHLEREYKAHLRKIKALDLENPSLSVRHQPYQRQRPSAKPLPDDNTSETWTPIATPLLEKEDCKPVHCVPEARDEDQYYNFLEEVNIDMLNKPLEFQEYDDSKDIMSKSVQDILTSDDALERHERLTSIFSRILPKGDESDVFIPTELGYSSQKSFEDVKKIDSDRPSGKPPDDGGTKKEETKEKNVVQTTDGVEVVKNLPACLRSISTDYGSSSSDED